jgi:tRNA dimethylallyltransferase
VRSKPPLIAVVGPTASGKSDLGIALALQFDGEIINCDSVQVYRRLYVATSKVPESERCGVPHHLIDIADPEENYTAVAWAERARESIAEIEARGRRAILVGGSGFYLKALTTRFFEAPEIDPGLRPRLEVLRVKRGAPHLHDILKRVDPVTAQRYAPRDWPRVIRALEVYFSSGMTLSTLQKESLERPTDEASRLHYLVLNPPRDELYERIDRRADLMVAHGLVKEVQNIIASGVRPDAKAFGAHGYRRVVEHLLGERELEDAVEQMKLDTRHYAKRQLTWWRKQPRTHWLNGFGDAVEIRAEAIRMVDELN